MMKFEEVEEELFNDFIVPAGLQTLDQLEMGENIPLTADYTQPN